MTRLLDKLTIATLCLVVLALLWRKAKEENTGGASPEFISRIETETEEGKKRLKLKQQSDRVMSRLER